MLPPRRFLALHPLRAHRLHRRPGQPQPARRLRPPGARGDAAVPWGPGQDQDQLAGPTLVVDWQRCRAHGLCAALAPELFSLDAHGFPVVSNAPIPVWLENDAQRAVNQCPALALRFGKAR
ncbi:ferredoxin [Peterkaempfera sp. SMS 1(5)a]|uniref:ferredoxin n=1 Tax=Peterkaempfera podocarpi TaxID=3232308 RepID=UPI0036711B79